MAIGAAESEIAAGQRFEFGANWKRFLQVLDDDRIREAELSLREMLQIENLEGKTFLDAGSGSGLFSLAAMRLGAKHVHSFDYDPESVACTQELQRRYFPSSDRWTIGTGSVLDPGFLSDLGRWDIVYSWGVLHHTGDMWRALENVAGLVKGGGVLYISIYNDQGRQSDVWRAIKKLYNAGAWQRRLVIGGAFPFLMSVGGLLDLSRLKNPIRRYTEYRQARGMSIFHDWVDWLGGYPFEVARPEEVLELYRNLGFTLERLVTVGGKLGCNEYVFRAAVAGPRQL